jgi:hypothetical protein
MIKMNWQVVDTRTEEGRLIPRAERPVLMDRATLVQATAYANRNPGWKIRCVMPEPE